MLFSLRNGSEMPEDFRERIQSWNKRIKTSAPDPGDNEDNRSDLPQGYSQLRDEHFPLFITTDTVSTTFVLYEREQQLMRMPYPYV
jgi:hypothetical protein